MRKARKAERASDGWPFKLTWSHYCCDCYIENLHLSQGPNPASWSCASSVANSTGHSALCIEISSCGFCTCLCLGHFTRTCVLRLTARPLLTCVDLGTVLQQGLCSSKASSRLANSSLTAVLAYPGRVVLIYSYTRQCAALHVP